MYIMVVEMTNTLKNFRKNASDIIEKHGFQIATGIYIAGNMALMAQNTYHPEQADMFKNIIAPGLFTVANLFGLGNKPRTANTAGFFGTMSTAASFAGAGGHPAQWLPATVATVAATGQCIASHIPAFCKWGGRQISNICSGLPVERWRPKEKESKSKQMNSVLDSDFVKGSLIQTGVGVLVTAGVLLADMKEMQLAAFGWNLGDMLKLTWAVKNAKKLMKEQQLQPAA